MTFRTALSFDMRSAPFGISQDELYAAALDMIAYADQHGIQRINISEHHASEDGYIPVPALLAAAAGARTRKIAISLGAIVLPLHDPVEVAEQVAVTDLICQGRLHVIFGAGYAHHEFKAFGKSLKDRGKLMDQGLSIIARALAGERFQVDGREIFVRPLPKSRPPKLYVGGGVPAAARRAARFNMGFWPMKNELIAIYEEECRKLGHEPGPILTPSVGIHVAENIERGWQEVGDYFLHQVQAYSSISSDPSESNSPMHGLQSVDDLRRSGILQVLTPDQALSLVRKQSVSLTPLVAGLSPDIGWKSLELFVEKVLSRL